MVSPDHYITLTEVHLWQNGTGWRAVIDQQEGTEGGASGDDLGAPFSLSAPSEERTYSPPPLAGGGMACGHRAPFGGGSPPGVSFPCRYIPADANGGLCIGRSRADHRGLGAVGYQQAAPGIYRCIACSSSSYCQSPKRGLTSVRTGAIL